MSTFLYETLSLHLLAGGETKRVQGNTFQGLKGLKEMAMFNSCFGLNRNSWNKSKAKNKNNYASLALVSLEQRVNPAPTVSISFNTNTGVLLLQSNALLNELSSYQSFQSTGTLDQQKILNFSASYNSNKYYIEADNLIAFIVVASYYVD